MKRKRESGQVLLIGLIAMLVIVLAVFVLFDLGNVIRGKVKAQNAVDVAALVGANWQRHTLNLVGELNLVKASSVLISDELFGIGKSPDSFLKVNHKDGQGQVDTDERWGLLKTASDTVSQMQQRALFILPLLGFGAAQQAAKNNGMNYNTDYADALNNQLQMVQGVGDRSTIYQPYTTDEFIKKELFGFNWRPAYLSVLGDIMQYDGDKAKGIAVMPNAQLLGVPHLKTVPPSGNDFAPYLQTRRIYDAIATNYWCWLKDLLRMDFSQQNWWGNLVLNEQNSFKRESEFLPVNVEIREAKNSTLNSLDSSGTLDYYLAKSKHQGEKLTKFYDTTDPVYRDDGTPDLSTGRDDKLNPLPAIDWAYYGWKWRDYDQDVVRRWEEYLTSPFKKHVRYYSGAISRMDVEQIPVTISGTMGVKGGKAESDALLGEGFGTFRSKSAENSLNRLNEAQKNMRYGVQKITAYTVAKPFGFLTINGEDKPPHLSEIVLPVFDHSAIIPASLENPGRNPLADYHWYEFLLEYLPVLGTVQSFDEMPPHLQQKFSDFHSLLKLRLNDPGWRQQGLDWLQTPKWQPDPLKPDEVIPTNEEDCSYWENTGGSSHPGSLH